MEFLLSTLKEEVKRFDLNSFEHTEIISVYRKRDVKKVEAILHVLCYKYATHQVAGDHFEILFN